MEEDCKRMLEDSEMKGMREREREYIRCILFLSLDAKHEMEFPRGCFRVTSFGERRPDGFAARTTTTNRKLAGPCLISNYDS